jgi:predicted HAD superfamily Cof-like phosphohydrolase
MSLTREDILAMASLNKDDASWEYWSEDYPERDQPKPTVADMVKEYHKAAGQKPDALRSLSMVEEEYQEWRDEVLAGFTDAEAELKELSDLHYVIFDYAQAKGWDLMESTWRLHKNNMGRMFHDDGTIKRREDGKIIKNPGYPKVDLSDLV